MGIGLCRGCDLCVCIYTLRVWERNASRASRFVGCGVLVDLDRRSCRFDWGNQLLASISHGRPATIPKRGTSSMTVRPKGSGARVRCLRRWLARGNRLSQLPLKPVIASIIAAIYSAATAVNGYLLLGQISFFAVERTS